MSNIDEALLKSFLKDDRGSVDGIIEDLISSGLYIDMKTAEKLLEDKPITLLNFYRSSQQYENAFNLINKHISEAERP